MVEEALDISKNVLDLSQVIVLFALYDPSVFISYILEYWIIIIDTLVRSILMLQQVEVSTMLHTVW